MPNYSTIQTYPSRRFHMAVDFPGLRRSRASSQIINPPQDFQHRFRGTATSAYRNVTWQSWWTTLDAILASFSHSVVSDQNCTSFGKVRVWFWLRVLKKSEPTDFVQLSFL